MILQAYDFLELNKKKIVHSRLEGQISGAI